MKKIELLAPAGSMESLEAAVKGGANAVYLAGQSFGARKSAANFTNEALNEAVTYCHLRGVKVYVTVNTLIADSEMPKLLEYTDYLAHINVDALIIQDLGVFMLLRKRYKNIELHCSTQMALHNVEDFKTLEAMGADRIVAPREMNLLEIEAITKQTNIEIEAFVHGALCVCVSGQCLMSSLIGGRSGNRGNCAQSCRQRYTLKKNGDLTYTGIDGDYLLSPRDLCTLEDLKAIIDAGVTSLKIEGRLKGPEYTYEVTKAYRTMIDQFYPEQKVLREAAFEAHLKPAAIGLSDQMDRLRDIFSRDFTKGYLTGEQGSALMSRSTPGNRGVEVAEVISYDDRNKEMTIKTLKPLNKGDDLQFRSEKGVVGGRVEYILKDHARVESVKSGECVTVNFKHDVVAGDRLFRTYSAALMKEIQMTLNDSSVTRGIHATFEIKVGQPARLELADTFGHKVVCISDILAEKALKAPLSEERLREQLEKFGGTPFHILSLDISTDGEAILPIKSINQLRRDASEQLLDLIVFDGEIEIVDSWNPEAFIVPNEDQDSNESIQVVASVHTLEQLKSCIDHGIKTIYYRTWATLPEAVKLSIEHEIQLFAYMGRQVSTQEFSDKMKVLDQLNQHISGYLAASPGQIKALKSFEKPVIADFSLNAFNCLDLVALKQMGADRVTFSAELLGTQIEEMTRQTKEMVDLEVIGYGRIPAMISRYCPINGALGGPNEGCQICRGSQFALVDKTGAEFPMITDETCRVELYNSVRLNIMDEFRNLEQMGVRVFRLNFTTENEEDMTAIFELCHAAETGGRLELKGKGFTKGHFRRGILDIE